MSAWCSSTWMACSPMAACIFSESGRVAQALPHPRRPRHQTVAAGGHHAGGGHGRDSRTAPAPQTLGVQHARFGTEDKRPAAEAIFAGWAWTGTRPPPWATIVDCPAAPRPACAPANATWSAAVAHYRHAGAWRRRRGARTVRSGADAGQGRYRSLLVRMRREWCAAGAIGCPCTCRCCSWAVGAGHLVAGAQRCPCLQPPTTGQALAARARLFDEGVFGQPDFRR